MFNLRCKVSHLNGVQTKLKCKPNVKRCKRFVFPVRSHLFHHNALKTKAITFFQADHILTRFVFPPLSFFGNYQGCLTNGQPLFVTYSLIVKEIRQTLFPSPHHRNFPITNRETLLYK